MSQRNMWKAYSYQKNTAKRRGIPWLFDFEMWVLWWEDNLGPDWFKNRGRKSGQYVMARKGDKGPYHPKNVDCAVSNSHSSEAVQRRKAWHCGENHKSSKLTMSEVVGIFYSTKSNKQLSKELEISRRQIADIKKQRAWRHITENL